MIIAVPLVWLIMIVALPLGGAEHVSPAVGCLGWFAFCLGLGGLATGLFDGIWWLGGQALLGLMPWKRPVLLPYADVRAVSFSEDGAAVSSSAADVVVSRNVLNWARLAKQVAERAAVPVIGTPKLEAREALLAEVCRSIQQLSPSLVPKAATLRSLVPVAIITAVLAIAGVVLHASNHGGHGYGFLPVVALMQPLFASRLQVSWSTALNWRCALRCGTEGFELVPEGCASIAAPRTIRFDDVVDVSADVIACRIVTIHGDLVLHRFNAGSEFVRHLAFLEG